MFIFNIHKNGELNMYAISVSLDRWNVLGSKEEKRRVNRHIEW